MSVPVAWAVYDDEGEREWTVYTDLTDALDRAEILAEEHGADDWPVYPLRREGAQ